MHYNADLSLAEIAELENISRQGVHDALQRAEALLREYEQKLSLYSRLTAQRTAINSLRNICANGEKQRDIETTDIEKIIDDIAAIWEDVYGL